MHGDTRTRFGGGEGVSGPNLPTPSSRSQPPMPFKSLQDNSGVLEKRDIEVKMTEMLGNFSWQDDGDGTMDTHEFVGAMAHMSPSVRMTAIMYAKTIL